MLYALQLQRGACRDGFRELTRYVHDTRSAGQSEFLVAYNMLLSKPSVPRLLHGHCQTAPAETRERGSRGAWLFPQFVTTAQKPTRPPQDLTGRARAFPCLPTE